MHGRARDKRKTRAEKHDIASFRCMIVAASCAAKMVCATRISASVRAVPGICKGAPARTTGREVRHAVLGCESDEGFASMNSVQLDTCYGPAGPGGFGPPSMARDQWRTQEHVTKPQVDLDHLIACLKPTCH